MATTTPNYGWPVPTSTDYVKDGATAIEALGDAIDATVFGLPSAGMTLINATSFSAVSSQSLNNVFTSTYQNYQIRLNITSKSTTGGISLRYRTSGTDNSSASYNQSAIYVRTNNTSAGDGATGATQIVSFGTSDGTNISLIAQIFNPQLSVTTAATYQYFGTESSLFFLYQGGHNFNNTTSFDGFSIYPASGTMTGTVYVYGLKK